MSEKYPEIFRPDNALTQKIEHTSGITPLVVVPGNKLDEMVIESDTGLRIENGGVVVTIQIS